MEGLPRWIEVEGGRDPVNFVAALPLDEVVRALEEDGWEEPRLQHAAGLEGRGPAVTLERPLLAALVRLHARLWTDGTVVGNVHLDVPALVPPRHAAFHDVGKAYLMYLFYRRGYAVELVYLANECESHDGRALKVYSRRAGGGP
jgi:hypothetical protein